MTPAEPRPLLPWPSESGAADAELTRLDLLAREREILSQGPFWLGQLARFWRDHHAALDLRPSDSRFATFVDALATLRTFEHDPLTWSAAEWDAARQQLQRENERGALGLLVRAIHAWRSDPPSDGAPPPDQQRW